MISLKDLSDIVRKREVLRKNPWIKRAAYLGGIGAISVLSYLTVDLSIKYNDMSRTSSAQVARQAELESKIASLEEKQGLFKSEIKTQSEDLAQIMRRVESISTPELGREQIAGLADDLKENISQYVLTSAEFKKQLERLAESEVSPEINKQIVEHAEKIKMLVDRYIQLEKAFEARLEEHRKSLYENDEILNKISAEVKKRIPDTGSGEYQRLKNLIDMSAAETEKRIKALEQARADAGPDLGEIRRINTELRKSSARISELEKKTQGHDELFSKIRARLQQAIDIIESSAKGESAERELIDFISGGISPAFRIAYADGSDIYIANVRELLSEKKIQKKYVLPRKAEISAITWHKDGDKLFCIEKRDDKAPHLWIMIDDSVKLWDGYYQRKGNLYRHYRAKSLEHAVWNRKTPIIYVKVKEENDRSQYYEIDAEKLDAVNEAAVTRTMGYAPIAGEPLHHSIKNVRILLDDKDLVFQHKDGKKLNTRIKADACAVYLPEK